MKIFKKLTLALYLSLLIFSNFSNIQVFAQWDSCDTKKTAQDDAQKAYDTIKYKYDSCVWTCAQNETCEATCEVNRLTALNNTKTNLDNAKDAYNQCIQNNQPNLSDYELCQAFIKNWAPVENCTPWDTKFYWRSCDKCCDGTTYNRYNNKNAKSCCPTNDKIISNNWNQECINCKECRDIYNQITKATNWSQIVNESERQQYQWEIKSYYENYRTKNCQIAFPDHNYSKCPDSTINNDWTVSSTNLGISCTKDQLLYGQCKLNVYDTLGIRQSDGEASVGLFVQDVVLSATMFIGTIVTIAIVISGLMFVFGWANPSLQDKAKKWLINSIIGLLIVMSSYVVIRLVQFIVKWG